MAPKLLVIDDEKAITTILLKIGAGLGFDVHVQNDSREAMVSFDAIKPDVVMLDLVMPDVDGIDILRGILQSGSNARLVVMTGFGFGYLRLAQAVSGFLDGPSILQLVKPFRRVDVVAALSADLVRGRALGAMAEQHAAA